MKKFKIITLGCKSNQFESDSISMQLKEKGYVLSKDDPDIILVNTCTVTSKAGMQSRQEIRKAARNNPNAKIIVTGCHSQIEPTEIKEIQGVASIIDQKDKNIIPKIIEKEKYLLPIKLDEISDCEDNIFRFMPSGNFEGKTRGYLKIQDGCNAFCSYCIIPYARGRSRSMEFDKVINQLEVLKQNNYKEIVLTGIHIGYYGHDLKDRTDFTSLIKYLAKHSQRFPRIRISSIEPNEISDEIIEIASDNSILCPHFHIPFQNGDNYILKKMNRPYRSKLLYKLTDKIYNKVNDVSIGADIITGFPGESEECFNNTYNLINDLPVTYLHVFPFSPRKNTPAASFTDQVNGTISKKRAALLRELSESKKDIFYKSQSLKEKYVLIENQRDNGTSLLKGFSENYINCFIDASDDLKNRVVKCKTFYNEEKKIMECSLVPEVK